MYLMLLPLVFVVVLLSGVYASLESRAALSQIVNRHLAYKAEQLRDHGYSEWEVITSLELDDQAEYRAAAEKSFRSYAYSLLRTETEQIIAVDSQGELAMLIGLDEPFNDDDLEQEDTKGTIALSEGWFVQEILGETRVGVAFDMEPFNWTVAVTELESTYFSDIENIRNTHIWILLVTTLVLTFLISIFIGHVVRPVERLTDTIGRITATMDLSKRAQVEFPDEIGTLAHKFNIMISSLQKNYKQLEKTSRAEQAARRTAVEREEETLYVLGRVSDFRDEDTGEHLERIGALAELFSELLGQSRDEQKLIRNSAPLHDIGKVGIPDSLLLKPGKLTAEEFEEIKKHSQLGHDLLKDAKSIYLIEGADIAQTHHERWDGSGYPLGLAGEAIPLSGRIVSIVDVFDALTSSRPYKEAWSHERALALIVEQRGKQFDPQLVDIFKDNFEKFLELLKD